VRTHQDHRGLNDQADGRRPAPAAGSQGEQAGAECRYADGGVKHGFTRRGRDSLTIYNRNGAPAGPRRGVWDRGRWAIGEFLNAASSCWERNQRSLPDLSFSVLVQQRESPNIIHASQSTRHGLHCVRNN
jgi:hypothetical protein